MRWPWGRTGVRPGGVTTSKRRCESPGLLPTAPTVARVSAAGYRPPEAFVHGGGEVVVVPARVASWLLRHAALDRIRAEVRGADPEVDAVLVALRVAGLYWRASATGSVVAPEPEAGALSQWLSTTQAADRLGITDRAVRLAISERRLPAEQVAGRWRITREDVEHYRAARAA